MRGVTEWIDAKISFKDRVCNDIDNFCYEIHHHEQNAVENKLGFANMIFRMININFNPGDFFHFDEAHLIGQIFNKPVESEKIAFYCGLYANGILVHIRE